MTSFQQQIDSGTRLIDLKPIKQRKIKKFNKQTLGSTMDVLVLLFGITFLDLSSGFCCSSSKPVGRVWLCVPNLLTPAPKAERSLANNALGRSPDSTSGRDRFLDGMLGKHLLTTNNPSLKIFTRSLTFNMLQFRRLKFIIHSKQKIEIFTLL